MKEPNNNSKNSDKDLKINTDEFNTEDFISILLDITNPLNSGSWNKFISWVNSQLTYNFLKHNIDAESQEMIKDTISDKLYKENYKALRTIKDYKKTTSFIQAMIMNTIKDFFKKKKKEKNSEEIFLNYATTVNPEIDYMKKENLELLKDGIEFLKSQNKDELKLILQLRFEEGMRYNNIAKILNLNEKNVKDRVKKSLKLLEVFYKEEKNISKKDILFSFLFVLFLLRLVLYISS